METGLCACKLWLLVPVKAVAAIGKGGSYVIKYKMHAIPSCNAMNIAHKPRKETLKEKVPPYTGVLSNNPVNRAPNAEPVEQVMATAAKCRPRRCNGSLRA